mmetsp:Transcript_153498/g.491981  ORF Transcript_153498/g.491981 Transcript_153498/m.491981 type:complete len:316 (+) Transcript_153498:507-1454(+)
MQLVAATPHVSSKGRQLTTHDFGGSTQGDDLRHSLGACPSACLLPPTKQKRGQVDASAHVQGRDTLRSSELVPDDRGKIYVHGLGPYRHFADALCCVGVHQQIPNAGISQSPQRCSCSCSDAFDVLDGADLVVRVHDGHKHSGGPDGRCHSSRLYTAFMIDIDIGNINLSCRLHGIETCCDSRMLDDRCDNMRFSARRQASAAERDASTQCHVVCLTSTTTENYLISLASQKLGDLGSCICHCSPAGSPETMVAGWIAKLRRNVRSHSHRDLGKNWRGGIPIEVCLALRNMRQCNSHATLPRPRTPQLSAYIHNG